MSPDHAAEVFVFDWLRPRVDPAMWERCFGAAFDPLNQPGIYFNADSASKNGVNPASVTQVARNHPVGKHSLAGAIFATVARSVLLVLEETPDLRRRYLLENRKFELLEAEVKHFYTCWIAQQSLQPLTGDFDKIMNMEVPEKQRTIKDVLSSTSSDLE